MTQRLYGGIGYLLFAVISLAAQDVASAVEGTVKKIDSTTKTVVVKTSDGAEHTFHFLGRTAVHGGEATAKASKDAFHGLKEGSEVAVHYTAKGGRETADEVDHIGKDGMKATDVTITHVDRGAKTVAVKTADGAQETYRLGASAVKDTGQGVEKAGKVTVYYTEEGGHKVAHFFKKAL